MHDIPLLRDLLILIVVSLVVVYLVRRVRVPAVVGFLLSGMLLGPGGLALIRDQETVEVLAEVGVALLLFTIGLKFSVREMLRLKHWVFGAGTLQVLLTIASGFAISRLLGFPLMLSVLVGFLLSMSSTAIVLKLQEERAETNSMHGKLTLSVLIFQDLAVVPLLLLVPMLGSADVQWQGALLTLAKSMGLLILILIASRLLIPPVLEFVVRGRSPELFTLAIIAIAMGTAYISSQAGLSLALGAFLAGIVISETHYSDHVSAQIMPMRDALSSVFFVSIGMLVHPEAWLSVGGALAGLTLGVILLKATVVLLVTLLFGLGLRNGIIAGLALAQVGEFAFLLLQAVTGDLLDPGIHQLFLSTSVLTMMLTPLLMILGPALAQQVRPRRHMRRLSSVGVEAEEENGDDETPALSQHVIIIGYGVNGRNVARALAKLEVPLVVVELNPRTVREIREDGTPVIYGDACQEALLHHARLEHAQALVIAIADPVAARCITAVARNMKSDLHIIVRTRFIAEVDALMASGANQVVPEEFETSLELVALTMAAYGATQRDIEQERALIRSESYAFLRHETAPPADHPSLRLLLTASDLVEVTLTDSSRAINQSLHQLDLRRVTGATIIGLMRRGIISGNPDPDTPLLPGDILLLFGDKATLQQARELLIG
ncbi:MAG: cation:proton antiporter domain-containing protein [Armatimonadota bacterium]